MNSSELEALLQATRGENQDLREELRLVEARLAAAIKQRDKYKRILFKVLETPIGEFEEPNDA